ncbi:DUF1801 domain-containing protein [Pseudaestuariivita sp.]|uniref:DUF1801 domain-containing protein n=1 Tax=Pseudaestuariivita sp. TaxID=2211669 RepID=UPI004059800B
MSEAVTVPTGASVAEFLASAEPAGRHEDALVLDALFRRVTGWQPQMWGPSIMGYGAYDYTYDSGRSGTFLATGFSPRKAKMSVYIMPGYADHSEMLGRLGPHKMGKACLYLGRLGKVDLGVLEELILAGLADLRNKYPVRGS